jgi:hypothetical protein
MADNYDVNKDRYVVSVVPSPSHPARRAIAVTPSDTEDVTNASGDNAPCYAKALYIGVSGDVAVVAAGDNGNSLAGTAVTFKAVPVGWFPVQVRRVMATNTTATNIVGLYDQ